MEKEVLFTEDVEPPGKVARAAQLDHELVSPSSEPILSEFHLPKPLSPPHPRWAPRFVVSERSRWIRRRLFPQATLSDWNDWRWQLRNRITRLEELERVLRLSQEERSAISAGRDCLPLAITPYYTGLLDPMDPEHPIRRTVVPNIMERQRSQGEAEDPLDEEKDSPVQGLVHRYPDRVLLLVTGFCSTYCRYCTRSRMVGHSGGVGVEKRQWEKAISYIEATPSVRDVLLSGGDALTLPDEALEWLLGRLRKIPHVEFLRIGTKVPAVLPQRITPGLTKVLRRFHPLWLSIHFTHPEELTPEVAQACERLADAGLPLGSQTVLLKGVNDDLETMKKLFHGLLRLRVKPYYLYQCDPIVGSAHFRTPVSRGLEIISALRGHTTGYAVPTYVIDAPGGGGKVPLLPQYVVGRDGDDLLLVNYRGHIYRYPDPLPQDEGSCENPSLCRRNS
ncbi:MAG: KamA family radical SAM protein [Thermodesulfobacteriota bacterium]